MPHRAMQGQSIIEKNGRTSGASWNGASKVRILADDLTGAADVVAPLAHPSSTAVVLLEADASRAAVVSFDARTRDADEATARQRIAAFARDNGGDDLLLLQKIDSLARGHVARDVLLLMEARPSLERVILCPAYPAQGRTVRDGRIHVAGSPLDAPRLTEGFARRGVPAQTLGGVPADADAWREGLESAFASGARVIVPDVASAAELSALAAAALSLRDGLLLVGSAGLAEALAGGAGRVVAPAEGPGGLCCVAGSQAPVARAQLDSLAAAGARRVTLDPGGWRGGGGAIDRALSEASPDRAVIFDIAAPAGPLRDGAAAAMAGQLAGRLGGFGAVLLTGGDTARAFLAASGVRSFEVLGAFEPGIPVCCAAGLPFRFLTKSGGFGDRTTLVRLWHAVAGTGETIGEIES